MTPIKPPPETLAEAIEDIRGAFYWLWEGIKDVLREAFRAK